MRRLAVHSNAMPSARANPTSKTAAKPAASKATSKAANKAVAKVARALDTRFLESLMGYNARRAALTIIDMFLQRMAVYDLRPVDFSVLSVIAHNPGVTSRQLCQTLGILPPNFVALLVSLQKRDLVQRLPHPSDKRAVALQLSLAGQAMMRQAEQTVQASELDATANLSTEERDTLMALLQKIYLHRAPSLAPAKLAQSAARSSPRTRAASTPRSSAR
jgi:DNA-binding MarR family transcriptional regulator